MTTASGETPTRVFVVDSHDIFRVGVATVLDARDGLEVVGVAAGVSEAAELLDVRRPQVLVIGIRGTEHEQLAAVDDLALPASVTVVVLTRVDHDDALVAALRVGARAFLTKDVSTDLLVETVRAVARGESRIDQTRAMALIRERAVQADRSDPLANLTPQERRILSLLAQGMSNREIAAELFLVEKTVRNHVTRVLAKLGVERRTQAALIAAKLDLVDGRA